MSLITIEEALKDKKNTFVKFVEICQGEDKNGKIVYAHCITFMDVQSAIDRIRFSIPKKKLSDDVLLSDFITVHWAQLVRKEDI